MSDRKKVIRAVETCFDSWIDKHRNMGLDLHEVERLKREALEMLKKQEPVGMNDFKEGQYIIYQNGDRFEIGKIKRLTPTGAFVWYSCADTAVKTPYDCMHPIQNAYVISEPWLRRKE